ncbi:PfkB family carbohydrate kinase, partial [Anaerotruncus colihominis]|uniref:PfkB family carbohydrate kinase n=1 Tax=Anaerotruncus colihominis TaxID=169435 RepID=UPI00210CB2C5
KHEAVHRAAAFKRIRQYNKSTVGAGDAALAGFIIAHDYKYDVKKSLQFAAAFGTASCLVEGTTPPRRISVAMVNNQVSVYSI